MTTRREAVAAIRFGFGLRPGEAPPDGAAALLAQLDGPTLREPVVTSGARFSLYRRFDALRQEEATDRAREEMGHLNAEVAAIARAEMRERAVAAALSPLGFVERLAWFWSGHFAVGAKNLLARALVPGFEPEAIRPHVAGRFRDLLRAAVTHPAMIVYLDQVSSVGPASAVGARRGLGLNENLAREIIELHTLGVEAGYGQADVRAFAELLTGLTVDRETGAAVFRANWAEPGAETVLGKSYGGGEATLRDIHAALDDLAAHPATARRITRKLAAHFVADAPPAGLVAAMEAAWLRTEGDLAAVYAVMLEHPESWSRFGEKVKQPFDFIVSSLRAVGPTEEELARLRAPDGGRLNLIRAFRRMNQMPAQPPGPQGWPEAAEAWITPQGLSARIDWASRLARAVEGRIDPRDFLEMALPGLATEETRFAATNAAERWEGIALALASPEFNRR